MAPQHHQRPFQSDLIPMEPQHQKKRTDGQTATYLQELLQSEEEITAERQNEGEHWEQNGIYSIHVYDRPIYLSNRSNLSIHPSIKQKQPDFYGGFAWQGVFDCWLNGSIDIEGYYWKWPPSLRVVQFSQKVSFPVFGSMDKWMDTGSLISPGQPFDRSYNWVSFGVRVNRHRHEPSWFPFEEITMTWFAKSLIVPFCSSLPTDKDESKQGKPFVLRDTN